MRAAIWLVLAAAFAASDCNKPTPMRAISSAGQPLKNETQPAVPPPGTGPDAKAPFGPRDAIDPKSSEAAGQIVQHYGALIARGRMHDAEGLWASSDSASRFALQLKRYQQVRLEMRAPGDEEGAAGSIYVRVPVTFSGKDRNDVDFTRSAEIILRRVNDVPGSSEAARRWHIERIDWKVAS